MSYEEFYQKISEPFRNNELLWKVLNAGNQVLTGVGYLSYFLLLWMVRENIRTLAIMILIPGISFAVLSLFRERYHAPRPYEVYPIHPLIHRKKTGKSCPSRHTFSMCLIGACWFAVSWKIGLCLSLSGILLGMIRVVGGIHFPKDILYGAGFGYLCGILTLVTQRIMH